MPKNGGEHQNFTELIELDPENPDHYKGMARVLIKQGDMDGATKY